MRLPALAAFAALLALPGCLSGASGGPDGLFGGGCATPAPKVATQAGTFDLLVPAAASEASGGAVGDRVRVTVEALEGQTLVATAAWVPAMGDVNLLFEPPAGGLETATSNSYQWTGVVPAGTYALELEGAPFAYEVVASVSLLAQGCPAA